MIPHISWYGKRFFLENLEGGSRYTTAKRTRFNLMAAPGYDRVFFYKNDFQNIFVAGTGIGRRRVVHVGGRAGTAGGKEFQVKDRHTTYLAGPEWSFTYGARHGAADRAS